MAIIDYHAIHCLTYAKLKRCSRILIPVLSCLCNDWDGSISKDQSDHAFLGEHAGLSTRSIQTALQELRDKGIINLISKRGKTPSIQYIPQLNLCSKNRKKPKQLTMADAVRTEIVSEQNRNSFRSPTGDKTPPTLVDKPPISDGKDIALKNNELNELKQQQPSIVELANVIGHALIKSKIGEKGSLFVVGVLKAIAGRGGTIEDPAGYFVSCCSRDVIPWSRKQKAEALADAKRRNRLAREETERQRWELQTESVIEEQNDPDAQERIREAQANFWEIIGEPEQPHNPPA